MRFMAICEKIKKGKISSHNPKVVGSNPASATTLCDQKRYRTGKPRSHNGFGVFSRPILTAQKKISYHAYPHW